MNNKNTDWMKTFVIMVLSTLLAFLFRKIGFTEINIIMVYILGVLFVSVLTNGYLMGIVASIVSVLCFNYFFTEPRFTLSVYDTSYLITFPIILIVTLITSTLTTRIQQQAEMSSKREERTQMLYQISRSFLHVSGKESIVNNGIHYLASILKRSIVCYLLEQNAHLSPPYRSEENEHIKLLLDQDEKVVVNWVFTKGQMAGAGTDIFSQAKALYMPINGQRTIVGVIGISCFDNVLDTEQKFFLETVIAQMAIAIDRELLSEEKENSKLEIERERLRSNLLRAISHDLRTPLTGIAGASSTILENGDYLDKDTINELLKGIYDDAEWLTRLVENLLSMTRIDEGKLEVQKIFEAVEEVVAESVQHIQKRAADHIIKIKIPDNLIMVPMDGKLIEQVLINLIDNALKYTPKGSIIEIKVYQKEERVFFEVSDNGSGIPEKSIKYLFDRFFTLENKVKDARRGIGLGLAICKSIITAHGGTIEAYNKNDGGAAFRFMLPLKAD